MITITEALAEIKTAQARIAKRREGVLPYVIRDARLRDPLESDGGSAEFVRRELQAIGDLEERVVQIRTAIQQVNLATTVTIEGESRTISAWLNWRRDIAPGQRETYNKLHRTITQARTAATQRGGRLTEQGVSEQPVDIIVAVRERDLLAQMEHLEATLGLLDGRLSLLNATTTIEV